MKKLLLHICCAPDQTVAHERTCEEYEITGFFSNSCIEPRGEYHKRLAEAKRLAELQGIELIEDEYLLNSFLEIARGLEKEPEKGRRCRKCIEFRLRRIAERAAADGFDIFATTLTVSPHKDAEFINRIGGELSSEFDVEYLTTNFKKKDGFKRSIELSNKLGLYRQNYCGCRFSLTTKTEREERRKAELEEVAESMMNSSQTEKAESNEIIDIKQMDMPPGAFFKPAENLSRRFKSGKSRRARKRE